MKTKLLILSTLFLLFSCNSKNSKDVELQQFSKVVVNEFKKKNVGISSSLHFHNPNEINVKVTYAEFDIVVNGKDVGTYISQKSKDVTGNGLFELPISIDFAPEDAFKNLDYGMVKIKSDVVYNVEMNGYLKIEKNGVEEKTKYSTKQKVLFSNNDKLYLDENGNLKEK